MAMHGEELWHDAIDLSRWGRQRIREVPRKRIPSEEILELDAAHEFDPSRFTFAARDVGLSGYELETILRDDYRIAVEEAEPINVMHSVTHGDSRESVRAAGERLGPTRGIKPRTPSLRVQVSPPAGVTAVHARA